MTISLHVPKLVNESHISCDWPAYRICFCIHRKKPSNRVLKLLSGSCYLPHPDKEETGGEDAHFIWDEQAIGVADGVGGWADQGIDSGQYSRSLMLHSVDAIEEEPKGSINPLRVLEKAYAKTKEKGSSTACIIALTDQVPIHLSLLFALLYATTLHYSFSCNYIENLVN